MKPKLRFRRRLLLVGLFFGLLTLLVAAHFEFWLRRPVGTGKAGPNVPIAPFQKIRTARPILLVGMGDSVTAGFGAAKGHSYFERLIRNPPDEFSDVSGISLEEVLPNLVATNLALSGSTSLDHLKQGLARLRTQPTNTFGIVVITTGGNDLIHNYGMTPPREGAMYGATLTQAQPWISNFAKRLELLIEGTKVCFPGGCRILLANIYDPTDGIGDVHRAGLPHWPDGLAISRRYNEIIAECAARHECVSLVDIHQTFIGHGIHCRQFWRNFYRSDDPHYWFHENLEDPNDRGYDALRRLFFLALLNSRDSNLW